MANKNKIRQRISYKRFEKIYNTLQGTPAQKAKTMFTVCDTMDDMKAFNYKTQSEYAYESLQTLLEDKAK